MSGGALKRTWSPLWPARPTVLGPARCHHGPWRRRGPRGRPALARHGARLPAGRHAAPTWPAADVLAHSSSYEQGLLLVAAVYSILALSLDLVAGATGLYSLGHAGLFALARTPRRYWRPTTAGTSSSPSPSRSWRWARRDHHRRPLAAGQRALLRHHDAHLHDHRQRPAQRPDDHRRVPGLASPTFPSFPHALSYLGVGAGLGRGRRLIDHGDGDMEHPQLGLVPRLARDP